jgi:hypothetical protein
LAKPRQLSRPGENSPSCAHRSIGCFAHSGKCLSSSKVDRDCCARSGETRRASRVWAHSSGTRRRCEKRSLPFGLGCANLPQVLAARVRWSWSRETACSSNAARSAAPSKAWVGKTQAVGHRVIPLVRMNSATASASSSVIVCSPSTMLRTAVLAANRPLHERQNGSGYCDRPRNAPSRPRVVLMPSRNRHGFGNYRQNRPWSVER